MRVFKYRGGNFERDISSLKENYFWSSNRGSLNDPCEGIFLKNDLEAQLELLSKIFNVERNSDAFLSLRKSFDDVFQFIDKLGIYSLSQTPLEELLWAHYSDSHKGFCIEYDLEELIKYENDYIVVPVRYENSPKSIGIHHAGNKTTNEILGVMIGVKSKAWEYEKETRIVVSKFGQHQYDFRAVKGIYFGLRMDEQEKDKVMSTLKGRKINYYQVTLEDHSFNFSFEQVEDKYQGAQKYKYSIAPIAEGAITPDLVHHDYKDFIDYLYKAAEIVRREPDCNEVEMVEFSQTKGDKKNPVIFVQYKRKENRWINHYLSIAEIDSQYPLITDI